MGLDAAGSVFPDDPEQVTVWSVRGYGADEVVAVRWRQDRVEAFLADALGARDRERVFRRLRRETP